MQYITSSYQQKKLQGMQKDKNCVKSQSNH